MAKYEEWLTADKLLLLEGWARQGLTDEQIATNIGVSRSTLSDWKKRYTDISDTLKKGKEIVDIQVENALLKRALGFEYIEVTEERILPSRQDGRHGGRTALTEREWQFTLAYFKYHCCYCGVKLGAKATKDHVIPLAKGGEFVKSNILPCCKSCNSSKKDRPMEQWFKKQPFYESSKLEMIANYFSLVEALPEPETEDEVLTVTKRVRKIALPDTTAQIFWLKNRRPDLWRDKQKDSEDPTIAIEWEEP